MTTRALYSAIGVSGYEHQGCWQKDGGFDFRMAAPQSSHKCPKCGNREAIHRGSRIESCMGLGSGMTGRCCSSMPRNWSVGDANRC